MRALRVDHVESLSGAAAQTTNSDKGLHILRNLLTHRLHCSVA